MSDHPLFFPMVSSIVRPLPLQRSFPAKAFPKVKNQKTVVTLFVVLALLPIFGSLLLLLPFFSTRSCCPWLSLFSPSPVFYLLLVHPCNMLDPIPTQLPPLQLCLPLLVSLQTEIFVGSLLTSKGSVYQRGLVFKNPFSL